MEARLQQQVRVSKMLSLGFVLSIAGIAGLGSLAAMIIGLRARSIIKNSRYEISGIVMAWWCIIVGALGTATLPPLFYHWVLRK